MKTRTLSWACAGLLLALAVPAFSQDYGEKKGQEADQPQMTAEQEAWIKAGAPGPNHEYLNYMVGKWQCSLKIWQPGTSEPMVSTGSCENKWIFAKRYVITEYKGDFMGEPFSGAGVTGYDNINKRFFASWLDSMSTGMITDFGSYDASSKTFTYTGQYKKPTGEQLKTKTVIKVVAADRFVWTMYQGENASDMAKHMEIVYERDNGTAAADKPVVRLVQAGCATCTYKMDGVDDCALAVKVDRTAYLVMGTDINPREEGLCKATKYAEAAGKVVNGKFVATSFNLKP